MIFEEKTLKSERIYEGTILNLRRDEVTVLHGTSYQADVSIEIAARYLRSMKNKHETYSKAIACYVCGSGAVAKGIHSREPGRSVMKTRSKIQTFLEDKNYV